MPTENKIIRIANTGFLTSDDKFYRIDWAAWPASYFIRMPKVTDGGVAPGHDFDFANTPIEVLKRNDGTMSYYGEVAVSVPAYSPISSLLELVWFSQAQTIGWRFSFSCPQLTHFFGIRVIKVGTGVGISPIGKYHAVATSPGELMLNPPYEVAAS